jgi:hypothetical protein
MIPIVLTDIGLATAVIGLVAVVKPLAFLGIRTRRRAAVVLLAGIVVTLVALRLPAPETSIEAATSALDRTTPSYQFNEVHSIVIRATPERIYRAIKTVTADEILLFRTLIWMRQFGQPLPLAIRDAPPGTPLLDLATRTTFVTLADGPTEVLVATVLYAPPGGERRPDTPDKFVSLRGREGYALATMNFAITEAGAGAHIVSTETRVYATDAASRRRFAQYWRIIYPGSAVIRRMWLRAIRERAEKEPS